MAATIPKAVNIGSAKGLIAGVILVIGVTGIVNSLLGTENIVRRFMRGDLATNNDK